MALRRNKSRNSCVEKRGGYIEKNNNNGVKGKGGALTRGSLMRGGTLVLLSGKNNVKRRKNTSKAKEKKKLNKKTNKLINNTPQPTKQISNKQTNNTPQLLKQDAKDKTHHDFFFEKQCFI